MSARSVEIVGGGLAGLSLGLALRRRGVAVTVFEAGEYPRHRVCGEFITGLDEATRSYLQLDDLLRGEISHREVLWFRRGQPLNRDRLPSPAIGLSRYALDCRLAESFLALGGRLLTRTRVDLKVAPAGRVFAHGRRAAPSSPWIGLKLHLPEFHLASPLEFHLGDNAYVGISAVENGAINICGLFRKRSVSGPTQEPLFFRYLRASGLDELATRLSGLKPLAEVAVAGLSFGRARQDHSLAIGDAFAMPPPFTGNGMAMAFQSAASAVEPLMDWVEGRRDWGNVRALVRTRLQKRFRLRLASAALFHPFMLRRHPQRCLAAAQSRRLLPFRPLYRALH